MGVVRLIICLMGSLSFLIALTANLPLFHYLSPLLAISTYGAEHFFLWQMATHLFIYPTGGLFSIGFLINLFFSLYLLYVVGTQISNKSGIKSFLMLFLGSGMVSGAVVMTLLSLFPIPFVYMGPHVALLSLMLGWVFIAREAQLLLFLTIPVKAKWLVAGFVGGYLLSYFANGHFIHFAALLSGVAFSYFYSLLSFQSLSPYPFLHRFEEAILRFRKKKRHKPFEPISNAKVYDFKTGKAILSDDQFMDECLAKITKKGKGSLTLWERFRVNRISKRRRKIRS